jgi:sterol 3beta-glucosyltransferase
MNTLLLTAGTRGDIQPYIALGQGLLRAGHGVTLAAPAMFEAMVREHGLRFAPLNDEVLKLKDSAAGKDLMEGKANRAALSKQVAPMLLKLLDDSWAAAQGGTDVVIFHPKVMSGAHIAEKLGVPAALSLALPMLTPTTAFPIPIFTGSLGGWFNRLTYQIILALLSAPYKNMINEWRKTVLDLPPRRRGTNDRTTAKGQPLPVLYSYSQHLIPRPADWPAHVYATGYWFLEGNRAWTPPPALERFLADGPPPVYVGFGSMWSSDPQAKAQLVIEALARAGQRGVLASGWGGMKAEAPPQHVIMIDEAPHDWLFERMSAIVHHGGAGTTAAALRAGKPQLICPFMGDQGFWGKQVYNAGVGPKPINQRALTVRWLADAIKDATTDTAMRERAAQLGDTIRAEDGVGKAVAIIEKLASPVRAALPT